MKRKPNEDSSPLTETINCTQMGSCNICTILTSLYIRYITKPTGSPGFVNCNGLSRSNILYILSYHVIRAAGKGPTYITALTRCENTAAVSTTPRRPLLPKKRSQKHPVAYVITSEDAPPSSHLPDTHLTEASNLAQISVLRSSFPLQVAIGNSPRSEGRAGVLSCT